MTEFISREAWGAREPDRRTRWLPSNLHGVTVHWFGSPDGATDHKQCDDVMRSVQNSHMAPGGLGVPGGGSDIGYNHVVCLHGAIFEGRGFSTQTGANGTTESNRNYAAACVMMGAKNSPSAFSPRVQASLKELIHMWFNRGTGRSVKKHGYWTGSSCPGPTIGLWVDARKWTDVPNVTDSFLQWIDDFVFWRLVTSRYDPPAPKPGNVPDEIPQKAWDIVAMCQKTIIYNGASLSFLDWAEKRFIDGVQEPPAGMKSVPSLWWEDAERLHKMLNDYAAKT